MGVSSADRSHDAAADDAPMSTDCFITWQFYTYDDVKIILPCAYGPYGAACAVQLAVWLYDRAVWSSRGQLQNCTRADLSALCCWKLVVLDVFLSSFLFDYHDVDS